MPAALTCHLLRDWSPPPEHVPPSLCLPSYTWSVGMSAGRDLKSIWSEDSCSQMEKLWPGKTEGTLAGECPPVTWASSSSPVQLSCAFHRQTDKIDGARVTAQGYFWPRIQSSPKCIHLFHTDLLSSFSGTGDQLQGTWEILLLGATGRQTGPPAPLIPQVSWGSDRTCFPLALTSSLEGSVILSSDSVLGTVRAAVRIPASLSAVDGPAGSLRARTAPAQT